MSHKGEIVITGRGVVSPIGVGNSAFLSSLEAGRSGVAPLTAYDAHTFPVPIAAEVKDFDARQYVTPRKSLKVMCREVQLGFAAARLALDEAAFAAGTVDPDRVGVLYGAEMFYCDPTALIDAYRHCLQNGQMDPGQWGQAGMDHIFPLWMLMYLPNMVACHVAIAHDARAHNNTIAAGDASGLLAIIEAVRLLERGEADMMIVGAAGSRMAVTPMVYRGDCNLSHQLESPTQACRPFDARRDGTVNGEGAGAIVLETAQHARARGARILARIIGCGLSFEGGSAEEQKCGTGLQRAMRAALQEAQRTPDELGHVNAHGLGTQEDDRREAAAIRAVLGDVPVTAPKSFFGNLGAGSAMVELVASLLGLSAGRIPYTLNYEVPDPACAVNVIRNQPLTGAPATAMTVNYSMSGQTAAIIVELR